MLVVNIMLCDLKISASKFEVNILGLSDTWYLYMRLFLCDYFNQRYQRLILNTLTLIGTSSYLQVEPTYL